ncbi:protein THEM6-like [Watersipora subatra]|uniref:protein THEM6-like n=1 Tax=Watersipora subatra TaxID=2589382 RepID=UPI00355C0562
MASSSLTNTLVSWQPKEFWYLKVAAGALAASRLFFDSYYFVRVLLRACMGGGRYLVGAKAKGLLVPHETIIWCTTTDLDNWLHMNNSRYNRECDFARTSLLLQRRIYPVLQKHRVSLGLAATTIRFRKSINFLQRAILRSKIVFWDERAFYIEQSFYRPSDSFVYATLYAKTTIVGASTQQVLEWLEYTGERPEPSPDLLSWISYIEQSSERLRPKVQ